MNRCRSFRILIARIAAALAAEHVGERAHLDALALQVGARRYYDARELRERVRAS